ncbi:MAG: DUF6250 domain-containing protein [Armatimonadota bacterium]
MSRHNLVGVLLVLSLLISLPMVCAQEDGGAPEVVIDEDFEDGMENWWVEGGEQVWVEDGRMHVKADPPADGDGLPVVTVWCRTPVQGNVRIEFDAHVINSRTNVPHINTLLCADPEGTPLFETRDERADAALPKYQALAGLTFTYYHRDDDAPPIPHEGQTARMFIRQGPDPLLLGATHNYHCQPGHTYRVEIIKRDDFVEYHVDGNYLLGVHVPEPIDEGLLGVRTFRSHVWWDNLKVTALD